MYIGTIAAEGFFAMTGETEIRVDLLVKGNQRRVGEIDILGEDRGGEQCENNGVFHRTTLTECRDT